MKVSFDLYHRDLAPVFEAYTAAVDLMTDTDQESVGLRSFEMDGSLVHNIDGRLEVTSGFFERVTELGLVDDTNDL